MAAGRNGGAIMIRIFYLALGLTRQHRDSAAIARSKRNALRAFATRTLARSRFHCERLAEAGLSPEDLQEPEQLELLPAMERSDLMERLDEIAVAPDDRNSWHELRTSGSSGKTLRTWVTPREAAIRQALQLRSRILAGHKPWHREAVVGSQATNDASKRHSHWIRRSIYLSAADDPQAILPELRSFAPDYLVAFPSTLLRFGVDHGLHPRLITTGSEVLDAETRELLERRFGAPVRDIYGAIETGLLAFQCSTGDGYHLNEDLVHFEFRPVPSEPDVAEVLVTPLHAEAVPLVRYRLGDMVRLGSGRCRCGSALRTIASIEGRRDDWLQRPDGREIPPAAIRAIFRGPGHALAYRVTQVEHDRVFLELETCDRSDTVAPSLVRTLAEITGSPVELVHGRIQPDPSGKIRAIRRLAEPPVEWRTSTLTNMPQRASSTHRDPTLSIPRLQLHLTERCNFACKYCYALESAPREDMALDTGCRAISFYLDRLADGLSEVNISFFGGEPLLKFPLIEQLVSYASKECQRRGRKARFSMTTNGALIRSDTAGFLARHNFSTLISWDGAASSQDAFRILPNQRGSSELMERAIPHILALPEVGVRITWAPATLPFLAANVRHLVNLGIDWVGFAPLDSMAFTEETLDEYRKQISAIVDLWSANLARRRFLVINPLLKMTRRVMDPSAPLHFHMHACDPLVNRISVGTDGSLFPCHRFLARRKWRLGSIWNGQLDPCLVAAMERYNREGVDGCLSMLDPEPGGERPVHSPDLVRMMQITLEGARLLLENGVKLMSSWSTEEIPAQARSVMRHYRKWHAAETATRGA